MADVAFTSTSSVPVLCCDLFFCCGGVTWRCYMYCCGVTLAAAASGPARSPAVMDEQAAVGAGDAGPGGEGMLLFVIGQSLFVLQTCHSVIMLWHNWYVTNQTCHSVVASLMFVCVVRGGGGNAWQGPPAGCPWSVPVDLLLGSGGSASMCATQQNHCDRC